MALEKKERVLAELHDALNAIVVDDVKALEQEICTAREVFCVGYGRSGLCSRGFAMRLMHLGLASNVVGEMTAHPIAAGDLLIVTSASGSSKALLLLAEKAKAVGARIALITTNPSSALAAQSDVAVVIPAQTKCDTGAAQTSVMPMGSLFEETAFILFDLMVADLMELTHQENADLVKRHANLE